LKVTKDVRYVKGKKEKIMGKYREWPDISKFKLWRTKYINARSEAMRDKMSPQ
jgi:hypothetical protein